MVFVFAMLDVCGELKIERPTHGPLFFQLSPFHTNALNLSLKGNLDSLEFTEWFALKISIIYPLFSPHAEFHANSLIQNV